MKGGEQNETKLESVLIRYLDHSKQSEQRIEKQMESLTKVTESTNEKLGKLAEVVAASEQRHIASHEGMKRLGEWRDKTDVRVTDLEKTVLLLDRTTDTNKLKFDRIDGLIWKAVGALAILGIVGSAGYLGFSSSPKADPITASVNHDTN